MSHIVLKYFSMGFANVFFWLDKRYVFWCNNEETKEGYISCHIMSRACIIRQSKHGGVYLERWVVLVFQVSPHKITFLSSLLAYTLWMEVIVYNQVLGCGLL